ncbi:MAG: ABC transporter substrate-binding protein [Alphaproteobacteria bacterium]|nr:ABC transporter substrate-binding protein [Alphaproteobacteria bacterium]
MRKIVAFAVGALAAAAVAATAPAHAVEISVTHWGSQLYGVPFAVAMEKGYFKEAGIDVTGVLTSKGGGTTVRNVFASDFPYGEVALPAAVAAAAEGFDLKIIHAGTIAHSNIWMAKPNSALKSIKDVEGKRIGFTSPRSVSQTTMFMILDKIGVPRDKVTLVSTGAVGAGFTALESGGIDAALASEPQASMYADKYRVVFAAADLLPPVTQTVGVTTPEFIRKEPKKLMALIAGRAKGVAFLYANPEEAGRITSKYYDLDEKIAVNAVRNMAKVKFWGAGDMNIESMNEMIRGLKLVDAIKGDPDWNKLIDRSLLPADLRS